MKQKQALIALAGGFMCVAPACDSGTGPGDEGADGVKQDGDGGTDTDTDTDTDAGTGDDTGTDTEALTIQVYGYIGQWAEGFPPIEGVTVRIVDHEEIPEVVTGADGVYLFPEVPAGEEIIIYAEGDENRESAASRTWVLPEEDTQIWPMFLLDKATNAFLAESAGITYDQTRGRVVGGVWRVTDDVLVGATLALDPEAGTLIYSGVDGLPDTEATGITENGIFTFWNTPIGEYQISATHPEGGNCWAAGPENFAAPTVRTFPDTATFSMGFTCD